MLQVINVNASGGQRLAVPHVAGGISCPSLSQCQLPQVFKGTIKKKADQFNPLNLCSTG
jgi:hypothetical protein